MNIFLISVFIVCNFILWFFVGRASRKPKEIIKYYSTGSEWHPAETLPEKTDEACCEEILITDGSKVDSRYTSSIYYNKKGQPMMNSYSDSVIVGWMYFPIPPGIKDAIMQNTVIRKEND